MRKLKKLIALTMCAVVMMSSSVLAETKAFDKESFKPGQSWTTEDGQKYSIPSSFSSKWSRKVQWEFTDEGGYVINACWVTVGYDTWGTKEDYMKGVGGVATYKVHGRVMNSKGSYSSWTAWKQGGLSGKVDVKHTGSSVVYCLELGN